MRMNSEEFQTLKRNRSAHLAQMTKLYKELERQMLSHDQADSVKQLHGKLCERFEQFTSVHLQCLDQCSQPEIIEELEMSYGSCHKNFDEFRERYSQFIAETVTAPQDVVNTLDDNAGSDGSHNSSESSSKMLESAKVKRALAEYRLRVLKGNQDLERKRRDLEMKQQLFDQESELELAKLEESVLQDDVLVVNKRPEVTDSEMSGQPSISSNHQPPMSFDHQQQISLQHQTPMSTNNRQPQMSNSDSSIDTAFQRLAAALHEGFSLPKPELLTFDGTPTDYSKFIKNFETNIESKINDNRLRLSYLIQYCSGEAKSSIEDCVLLDNVECYKRARSILYSRYGRPYIIARSYIDKLVYGAQIKASDVESLSKLSLEMQKCEITLSQLGFVSDIDNSENLRRIVRRLPIHLRTKWVEIAHSINEFGREACFSDLSKFVDEKSRIARSMYGYDICQDNQNKGKIREGKVGEKGVRVTTLNAHAENSDNEKKCCCCCNGNCADLASCRKFKSLTLNERCKLVRTLKLCFNCLKGKHFVNRCRKPKQCTVPDCDVKHHALLHSWVKPEVDQTAVQSSCHCAATGGSVVKNCLGIIPVIVQGRDGNSCQTYALLDDGADKTLCDERLLQILGIPSRPVTFRMSTVTSTDGLIHGKEVDLDVKPIDEDYSVSLKKVWTVKRLPISTRSISNYTEIRKLPYLSDIDIPKIEASDVMLLIGIDSPNAHIPLEVRSGNCDQPYAIRTRLGWAIRGPIYDNSATEAINVHFGESGDVVLRRQLEQLWKTDFNDQFGQDKDCMSVEDKKALAIMESTTTKEDGRYKLGLPWRDVSASMPNNINLAETRLQHSKRKLSRDENLHNMYTTTINEYLEKGYAREVTDSETDAKQVWYLPHHPVENVNKPGKVRVVFDCAAKYCGISLNSQLLQGPDFMNSLVGVLIKFRQEHVALTADIEAMFHQVRVLEGDCDALRFLWWPNGDIKKQPKQYCMQVHLFGATSSPSCAAYALKRTARDNDHKFEPEVIETVERNFYVDDCLKSVSSEKEAISLATDLQKLMSMGGFGLTKWLSNSRNVLQALPESERAKSVVDLDSAKELPSDKALGVIWDVNDDKIKFKVKLEEKPVTRRGILSTVSSIFDPLGLVSPITLQAKAIIQNLCRAKLGWDDQIPQIYHSLWRNWLKNLLSLEDISINRCYQPSGFSSIKNAQLHFFSDGSEIGYGACAYLRLVDEQDNIACSLVMGKSRLAPMKNITIPRMELAGAVVACRLYDILTEELEIKIDQVAFWTDSMILLGYIRNTSKRFKTFVANRLSIIHETTIPDQWRHVDSQSNPADIASRGISACDTQKLNVWLHGPEFLWKTQTNWPKDKLVKVPEIEECDVEVKKEAAIHTLTCDTMDSLMIFYSDWTKMRRAVAWLIRFKDYCKERYLHYSTQCKTGHLTLSDMKKATTAVLGYVQMKSFSEEISDLAKGNPVKTGSPLAALDPVLYDGLIRVKGRLNFKDASDYPIVLPSRHNVTTIVIRNCHEAHGHAGIQQVLATTRRKYWILRGHSSVKKVVRNCFLCKRQNGLLCKQQMAPLRDEQLTSDKPPFTFVGIDYFGPMMVKLGRSQVKRYGCIFSCLTSRAVHLEVAQSLGTDSFIAAFQRFVCRRGVPEKVFSDNGTNLVGGDKELRKSIQEWNQSEIGRLMLRNEIEWHFNPPSASHMGGAWERMIRSTRKILKSVAKEQLLTDEQLLTLMAEVEKILKDRPITRVSDDPNDPPALTPNMIILMKSNSCIPQGVFKKEDSYARRRWKQVQYLANVFWKQWIREYLPTIQSRQRWQRSIRDFRIGDIVLVAQENIPRGQWPLGRVIDVNVGRDGHTRSCLVKTSMSELVRPITKLCLLESSD